MYLLIWRTLRWLLIAVPNKKTISTYYQKFLIESTQRNDEKIAGFVQAVQSAQYRKMDTTGQQ